MIHDIWAPNVDDAFRNIHNVLQTQGKLKCFVALDTEFCRLDHVVDPGHAPQFPDVHYAQACRAVNDGDLMQVGIFLAKHDFEAACPKAFQFNIKFDASTRSPNSKNVKFLCDIVKLDLPRHADQGMPLQEFIKRLKDSGLDVTWVTFQAYADFGYLIRGIEEVPALLIHRWEFLSSVRKYFPSSYDIKVFHQEGVRCTKPRPKVLGSGKLSALAAGLEVIRIGQDHGAASDAHLTLGCLRKMMLRDPVAAYELRMYKDIMYGVMPPHPCHWSAILSIDDVCEVDVWAGNFERQIEIIASSLNGYTVLAAEVKFQGSSTFRWQSYARAREVGDSANVDVGIAFSDWSGHLAFGRIWTFHLFGAGEEQDNRINAFRWTEILARSGAVLTSRTTRIS